MAAIPKRTGHILNSLRKLMSSKQYVPETIHAYIVPSGDAHQSEYIAPRYKRREFVSGFTGSAGTAIVTENEALLWTDGRYFLQAENQLDENWTLMKDGNPDVLKKEEWLSQKLPDGATVGVDPHLLSLDEWRRISKALKNSGKNLIRVDQNLVDLVWCDLGQPEVPSSNLLGLPLSSSGRSWEDKVNDVRERLKKKNAYGFVVASLDEVAWLFNLRGGDIVYNPVFMSYAIVTLDNVSLFIDESRLTNKIKDHLKLTNENGMLKIFPYNGLQEELRKLGQLEKKIWISSRNSCALASLVPEKYLITDISPIASLKAVKNPVEIEGMRNAHIRDGGALCEYLCWLEKNFNTNINEAEAAEKLDKLRSEQDKFVSLSFETISSIGPNCAVIHYKPEMETAKVLSADMYLCDSGGQYLDGTTDVTRTIHLGTPTDHQKETYTRVLKGHIQLARAVFPKGTRGHILDVLARAPLWEIGLEYAHGTGHGVGAFLNVHEGPIGISPKNSEDPPLESGMFLSDEPGYYEDGSFGIRIENIIQVVEKKLKHNYGNRGYLGFEVVTMAPLCKELIVPQLLSTEEVDWINDYHSEVFEKVGSYLRDNNKTNVVDWLKNATSSLG